MKLAPLALISVLSGLSSLAYATPTIVISKASQSYTLMNDHGVVKKGRVSTGKRGYSTPSGSFTIHTKVSRAYSLKYGAWMENVMLFKGTKYALHRGVVPGYPASHGCVRLDRADAAFLYKTLPIGTTVIVR